MSADMEQLLSAAQAQLLSATQVHAGTQAQLLTATQGPAATHASGAAPAPSSATVHAEIAPNGSGPASVTERELVKPKEPTADEGPRLVDPSEDGPTETTQMAAAEGMNPSVQTPINVGGAGHKAGGESTSNAAEQVHADAQQVHAGVQQAVQQAHAGVQQGAEPGGHLPTLEPVVVSAQTIPQTVDAKRPHNAEDKTETFIMEPIRSDVASHATKQNEPGPGPAPGSGAGPAPKPSSQAQAVAKPTEIKEPPMALAINGVRLDAKANMDDVDDVGSDTDYDEGEREQATRQAQAVQQLQAAQTAQMALSKMAATAGAVQAAAQQIAAMRPLTTHEISAPVAGNKESTVVISPPVPTTPSLSDSAQVLPPSSASVTVPVSITSPQDRATGPGVVIAPPAVDPAQDVLSALEQEQIVVKVRAAFQQDLRQQMIALSQQIEDKVMSNVDEVMAAIATATAGPSNSVSSSSALATAQKVATATAALDIETDFKTEQGYLINPPTAPTYGFGTARFNITSLDWKQGSDSIKVLQHCVFEMDMRAWYPWRLLVRYDSNPDQVFTRMQVPTPTGNDTESSSTPVYRACMQFEMYPGQTYTFLPISTQTSPRAMLVLARRPRFGTTAPPAAVGELLPLAPPAKVVQEMKPAAGAVAAASAAGAPVGANTKETKTVPTGISRPTPQPHSGPPPGRTPAQRPSPIAAPSGRQPVPASGTMPVATTRPPPAMDSKYGSATPLPPNPRAPLPNGPSQIQMDKQVIQQQGVQGQHGPQAQGQHGPQTQGQHGPQTQGQQIGIPPGYGSPRPVAPNATMNRPTLNPQQPNTAPGRPMGRPNPASAAAAQNGGTPIMSRPQMPMNMAPAPGTVVGPKIPGQAFPNTVTRPVPRPMTMGRGGPINNGVVAPGPTATR